MNSADDRRRIRQDRHLQWLMKTSIPLAIVSIACLWAGYQFQIQPLGTVFFLLMPVTLVLGFAYNLRYLILSLRQRRG